MIFLSTPSARRATSVIRRQYTILMISIHALREEGDIFPPALQGLNAISIHALREEGDDDFADADETPEIFLSTPSARRATQSPRARAHVDKDFYPRPPRGGRHKLVEQRPRRHYISIHALREEGDSTTWMEQGEAEIFLSTPSARRATKWSEQMAIISVFLSTPSARRATAKTETKSLFSNKLYNILHEFRRALIYNGSKNYPNHAK